MYCEVLKAEYWEINVILAVDSVILIENAKMKVLKVLVSLAQPNIYWLFENSFVILGKNVSEIFHATVLLHMWHRT